MSSENPFITLRKFLLYVSNYTFDMICGGILQSVLVIKFAGMWPETDKERNVERDIIIIHGEPTQHKLKISVTSCQWG